VQVLFYGTRCMLQIHYPYACTLLSIRLSVCLSLCVSVLRLCALRGSAMCGKQLLYPNTLLAAHTMQFPSQLLTKMFSLARRRLWMSLVMRGQVILR